MKTLGWERGRNMFRSSFDPKGLKKSDEHLLCSSLSMWACACTRVFESLRVPEPTHA